MALPGTFEPGLCGSRNPACAPRRAGARYGALAAYAYGLARNHGLSDDNKRTAWVVARVFLAGNEMHFEFAEVDAIRTIQAVAGGDMDE